MVLISVLRMICDHGEALLPRVALEAWRNRDAASVGWAVLKEIAAETKMQCARCGQPIDPEEGTRDFDTLELSSENKPEPAACQTCMEATARSQSASLECLSSTPASPSTSPTRLAARPSSKVIALTRNVFGGLQSENSAAPPAKWYVLFCSLPVPTDRASCDTGLGL